MSRRTVLVTGAAGALGKVTAQNVVEAVLFLAADRSAKTTGAMIPADGGIKEAFPR